MITRWSRKWKDGRRDDVAALPDEIDLSSPSFSLSVEKVERELEEERVLLQGIQVPRLDTMTSDFRAMDAKVFPMENGHHGLYLVYASKSSGSVNDGPPYQLFFGLYDLNIDTWVRSNVQVSEGDICIERRAVINRYQSGMLWVVYTVSTADAVYSCISADEGVQWTGHRTVVADNDAPQIFTHEEDQLVGKVTKGTWTRAAFPNSSGGYMLYSNQASTKLDKYIEFKVAGEHIDLVTYVTKDNYNPTTKRVGQIKVYIDNKYHKTIDLSVYPTQHQKYLRLNKAKLSDAEHTVRLYHISGKYFYFDAVRHWHRGTYDWVNCSDAVIRSTGVNEEAIITVDLPGTNESTKATYIYADRSGTSSHWGTAGIKKYLFRDNYSQEWGLSGMFHENHRGLWLIAQENKNGKSYINHYLYQGATSTENTYTSENWQYTSTRGANDNKAVRYTAATIPFSSTTVVCTAYRGLANRTVDVEQSFIAMTPDLEFPPIEAALPEEYTHAFGMVNYPSDFTTKKAGVLCVNADNIPYIVNLSFGSTVATISNLTDYATSAEVSHDATPDPSDLRVSFFNPGSEIGYRDEWSDFWNVLPQDYDDHAPRLVTLELEFDQGPFSYTARFFTGTLTELKYETSRSGDEAVSISAYDFAKVLSDFHPPYYLVYANAPLEWSETADDYPLVVAGEVFEKQPIREKQVIKKPEDAPATAKDVTVGWDLGASLNTSNFYVDTNLGKIVQSGDGVLLSALNGKGDQFINALLYSENGLGSAEVGLQVFKYDSTLDDIVTGTKAIIDFGNNQVRLYYRVDQDHDFEFLGSSYISLESQTYYRIKAYCYSKSLNVEIVNIATGDSVKVAGTFDIPGFENTRRVTIGSRAAEALLRWDSIYICSASNATKVLKTDKQAAEDIVARAFQGFYPLIRYAKDTGEYFTSNILHPQISTKDSISNLAIQNGKVWYFDYDGTLVWDESGLAEESYTITDDEIESLSRSINSREFKNWVEVVDDKVPPKIRLSVADSKSILKHGIHFEQEENSEVVTKEQAKKLALAKFYENVGSSEQVEVVLSKPLVFIKPRDVVRVSSPMAGIDASSDDALFFVDSVQVGIKRGRPTMSLVLTARSKALMGVVARIYDGGVTDAP